jgi:hypothetical protein
MRPSEYNGESDVESYLDFEDDKAKRRKMSSLWAWNGRADAPSSESQVGLILERERLSTTDAVKRFQSHALTQEEELQLNLVKSNYRDFEFDDASRVNEVQ